jgi:hypothetical protein
MACLAPAQSLACGLERVLFGTARFGESAVGQADQRAQLRRLATHRTRKLEILCAIRGDQRAQGFRLDEVHPPVENGAAGVLARLGLPRPQTQKTMLDLFDQRASPVRRDLHDVLSGVRVRRPKVRREHLVERLATLVDERRQVEPPRLGWTRQRR